MTLIEVLRSGRQCDNDGVEIIMSRQACLEAADEIERLRKIEDAVAIAYGYLWNLKTGQYRLAHDARKVLRDLMTHDQRGDAIKRVRELMGFTDDE